MKKKWITVMIITILALSVGFNVYFFGYKFLERKTYSRGVNDAVNTIAAQAVRNGQIAINTQEGQIVLVIKKAKREPLNESD